MSDGNKPNCEQMVLTEWQILAPSVCRMMTSITLFTLLVTGSGNQLPSSVRLSNTVEECSAKSEEFSKLRSMALKSLQIGDLQASDKLLQSAYAICPNDYANGIDLVKVHLATGQSDEAEQLLRKMIGMDDSAELHTLLAGVEASRKDFKAVAAEYQRAAQMLPSEENLFAFGTSLMKIDFGAATSVLQYGLTKYPSSVKMHVALGLAFYAQGRAGEGAALLCEAAALDPSDAHPMEVLADTRVVPRPIQPDALRHLADLSRRYPDDGLILFDYAMVKSGRLSGEKAATSTEFLELVKHALTLNPRLAKAYFELSTVYAQAKDYASQIEVLRKAVEIEPENERYHFALAFAYRNAGKSVEFQEELKRYTKLHAKAGAGDAR